MAQMDYQIIKTLVVFPPEGNRGFHKELNLISWNGRMPKYDLRSWTNDHETMTKGVTLTEEQMKEVAFTALKGIDRAGEFAIKTFGRFTDMHGDMVTKLGKYEDLGEPEELAKKLGIRLEG